MGCETSVLTTTVWECDFCDTKEAVHEAHQRFVPGPVARFCWITIRNSTSANDPADPEDRLACGDCVSSIQAALKIISETPGPSFIQGSD